MLDYEFSIEQYGENHNEVRLDRLVRMVSAVARGSNVYSEEEFQLLYKEILDKMDDADSLEEDIRIAAYSESMMNDREPLEY